MSDVIVQEKPESLAQDKSAESAKQSLSNDSVNARPVDTRATSASNERVVLPQIEFFNKAEANSQSAKVLNPREKEFKETCELYEKAIKLSSKTPSVDEVKKMSPEMASATYEAMRPEYHVPAGMLEKYAQFLSKVGEKNNMPGLRERALSNLMEIEKVDKRAFDTCPRVVGEVMQLKNGGWINQEKASSLAFTTAAIQRLGVKSSNWDFALNGFSGPSDTQKRYAVEGLAESLQANSEYTREMIKSVKKDCSSGSAALLDDVMKKAEVEAAKLILKDKARK